MSDQKTFPIGPPESVTDSRELPAVTAAEEAGFVRGADLGAGHPDNVHVDPGVNGEEVVPEPDPDAGEDLPGEDALDAVLAGVDPDAVDTVGFDDTDLVGLDQGLRGAGVSLAGGV